MKGKKKARTITDNRFAPLSSLNDLSKASQNNTPTRSYASEPKRDASRSPSPSPSTTSTSPNHIYTSGRVKTYPPKTEWKFPTLTPPQLARCGFVYTIEKETCFCPVCDLDLDIYSMAQETWDDGKLLTQHGEECILADTIYDMIFNGWHNSFTASTTQPATTTSSQVQTQTAHESSQPSSQDAPATIPAATTPAPTNAAEKTTFLPKSKDSPTSSPQPSYAAVASSPRPKSPETILKAAVTSNAASARPKSTSDQSSPPSTPSPSPSIQHTQSRHTTAPSPVLSVYDLEQRFRNKPSPISFNSHNHGTMTGSTISMVLPKLLHAIADLFQTCGHEYALPHQPQLYLAEHSYKNGLVVERKRHKKVDERFQKCEELDQRM